MIRILMLEDSSADAELAMRELKRAGLLYESKRVETESDFRDGLAHFHPDIIISDFSLPQFDGLSALHIARATHPDIPFIFVSGTIGEENAIESLKQGAADYLFKSNLARLPGAVGSALKHAHERAERLRIQRELENSNRLFRVFMQNLPAIAFIKDQDGNYIFANKSISETLKLSQDEIIGSSDQELFPEKVVTALQAMDKQALEDGNCVQKVQEIPQSDENMHWLLTTFPIPTGSTPHVGGIGIDITEQRKMEEALILRDHAIEASATPIMIVDTHQPDMPIIYVNKAFRRVSGYSNEEVMGRNPRFLQNGDHDQPELEKIRTAIRKKCPALAILRNYHKDGTLFWNELYIAPVNNSYSEEIRYFVGVQKDITQIRMYQEALERQANYDTLTGLANRNLLNERMQQAFLEGKRYSWIFTVAFIDIDNFKRINDSMGHNAGDELVRLFAVRLQSCLREGDTVARIGGDEFVLLLNTQSIEESTHTVIQRIRKEMVKPFDILGRQITITCSIGLASFPRDGETPETLLSNADSAMYQAKASGKNNFRFYAKEMNAELGERLSLENDLWQALDRKEMVLHYQPQINIKSSRIIGMEALVRWQHPKLGLLPPLQFIPMSEDDGLIVPIGEWVLETACRQNRMLHEEGLPPFRVAVNLSARQLEQRDFLDKLKTMLNITGLDPKWLELEITESMIMHNVEEAIRILEGITDLGVQLSLDDFGTGYSSLAYLKRLPIHRLKIDKSFIHDIPFEANDAIIARSIISLAHGLQLVVIAEGVETEAQLGFLEANRCDEIQGYLLSRPLAFEQLREFLVSRS